MRNWSRVALVLAALLAAAVAARDATDCVTRQEYTELTAKLSEKLLSQEAKVASLEAKVQSLEAKVQSLTVQLKEKGSGAEARNRAAVGVLGEIGMEEGRRLSAAVCCRWSPGNDCGSSMTEGCTALHEYLEEKTTMYEFENVETCLGGTDHSKYIASYDGVSSNIRLKYDTTVVMTTATPLKVTLAAACATTEPTLTLQMSTDVPKFRVPIYCFANGHGMTIGGVTASHKSTDTALGTPMPPEYVAVDLNRQIAFLMMVNSGRLLLIRHAETGRYLGCQSNSPYVKNQDSVDVDEKFRIGNYAGQMTITCRHNDYNRNLGMNTNGFALQATGHVAGVWERFQIWVPDSGGVTNGACNHPGAAHIYNAGHQRYIECDASGCKRGEFVTDTDKCNSAWHFHYAAIE